MNATKEKSFRRGENFNRLGDPVSGLTNDEASTGVGSGLFALNVGVGGALMGRRIGMEDKANRI